MELALKATKLEIRRKTAQVITNVETRNINIVKEKTNCVQIEVGTVKKTVK